MSFEDCECYAGPRNQVPNFEVATNCITNYAQASFESGRDSSEALRELTNLETVQPRLSAQASGVEDESDQDRKIESLISTEKASWLIATKSQCNTVKNLIRNMPYYGDISR